MQRTLGRIDKIVLSLLTADLRGGQGRYFEDGKLDRAQLLDDAAIVIAVSDVLEPEAAPVAKTVAAGGDDL